MDDMNEIVNASVSYAAEGLSIKLPVPQEDIKETIEGLRTTLANIAKAQDAVVVLMDLVRNSCEHPEKVPVSYTGHLYTRCTTCGKEW